ncbi:MAG: hypothetical protein WKF81_08730 [Thermomicrobiales bacterium]
MVELGDELARDDAYDTALQFLPDSAELDAEGEELEAGELLFTGSAAELDVVFDTEIYEAYEVGTFLTLFSSTSELSQEDIDRLVEILESWDTVSDLPDELTVPDGYECSQTTFQDVTEALEGVSAEFLVSKDVDVDAITDLLTEAEGHLVDLDELLTAEGF